MPTSDPHSLPTAQRRTSNGYDRTAARGPRGACSSSTRPRTTRRPRRRRCWARSPRRRSTTSAATSRCRCTTARSPWAAPSATRSPSLSTTSAPCPPTSTAVTLECAGNGRLQMRPLPTGEPWGDYAVSTARWRGARLSDVLALAQPAAEGVEVRLTGADHGAYHLTPVLADTDREDLAFERSLPLSLAADPAADILIAYEMNGEPLEQDHGAPFRLIVPRWYAVTSVKWLSRIDVLTEPFDGRVPDRALHLRVGGPAARSRWTSCGCAPGSPPPRRVPCIPAGTCTVRGKAWTGNGPIDRVEVEPHRRRANGSPPNCVHRPARITGRSGASNGMRPPSGATPCASGRPTLPVTSSRRCRTGTGSATATTPSR